MPKHMPFCKICPRHCPVDRTKNAGFCGAGKDAVVAKVMLHPWEEPCICRGAGCGAVFFAGCNLRCVFCQNSPISRRAEGRVFNENALCSLFFDLEEKGASCLDLVSPTPYLAVVLRALEKAKAKGLSLPVVWNSGGYESIEALRSIADLCDIYLPDFKFFDPELARALCGVADYPETCKEALLFMQNALGKPVFSAGRLLRGVLVRHLVLPNHTDDSAKILDFLHESFSSDGIVLSLMRQYTPAGDADRFPDLCRRLTTLEYQKVERLAQRYGFRFLYTQKKESATKEYIPDFTQF